MEKTNEMVPLRGTQYDRPDMRGTYVWLDVLHPSGLELAQFIQNAPFECSTPDLFHCTVMESKSVQLPDSVMQKLVRPYQQYSATLTHLDCWGGYIVGLLNGYGLNRLHEKWMQAGAKPDHLIYHPHVSLSQPGQSMTSRVEEYINHMNIQLRRRSVRLLLGNEQFEPD